MDKEIYEDENVGKYFNDNFISVKVQMDRTKNDNAFTQSWYNDANEIGRHYLLEGYPSFLFFSPLGTIVHKETGFKEAGKLIAIAQTALTPGKELNDDFVEYEQLMAAFKQGYIRYDRLIFMITIAKKLGDTVSRQLLRLYTGYVSALPANERYIKGNIEFWATLTLSALSTLLQYFYRDGDKIDKVMRRKGYSAAQVDKCIQNLIVTQFINEQLKGPDARSGVTTINRATGVQVSNATCFNEANWDRLYQLIRKDFNKYYAKRNVMKAKAIWYEKNSNWLAFSKTSLKILEKYPPDLTDINQASHINDIGWAVFLRIKDKRLINEAIIWLEKLTIKWNNNSGWIDTYANLLYKAGRKDEAIRWQEKAVSLNPNDKWHEKALEQMKKGEPTYGVKW